MHEWHLSCSNLIPGTSCFSSEWSAYLIFNANFSSQSVFCAPLLGERQPVLGPLVLGLQGACDLAVVNVGGARCFKLLDGTKINQHSTAKLHKREMTKVC